MNRCHRMSARTSWAEDHIAISGIYAIARAPEYSLGGAFNSAFWVREWGYPAIGVYFANCPSGGHDMLCLDYRDVAAGAEPRVVHVDQDLDYRITPVAPTFEQFIRGLEPDAVFEEYDPELEAELAQLKAARAARMRGDG